MNGIRFYPVVCIRLVRYGIRAGAFIFRHCKISIKKALSKYFHPYTDSTRVISHLYNSITSAIYITNNQYNTKYML